MSKQIGFLNEMKVMVELLSQGFVVSKPQGDYCPYDLISDHKGILHRLQIKSTTRGAGPASRNRGLKVLAAKGSQQKKKLTKININVIPIESISTKTIYVHPEVLKLEPRQFSDEKQYHRFEKYRNCWALLQAEFYSL